MSTVATADRAPAASSAAPSSGRTHAELAIARRSFHQLWKGATVCAIVFAGTAASSALAYVQTFPDEASRKAVAAATGADTGLAILLGPVGTTDTVGGYTVYKGFVTITAIGAIWALLAATRLLRGEEDAGRWQLVLAGGTRAPRATAATLAALGAAVAVVFVGTTVLMELAGRSPDVGFGSGETVLYGLSIAAVPAVFAAVGAVTSQLGRTRRAATGLAMAVFAVAMVVRMVADASADTVWLRWATPFGWSELMAPYTENNTLPLVPAVLTTAVLTAVAIALSGRRDAGDGVLASSDVSRPRTFGLGSAFGLATRLELPVLVAWWFGALALGLGFGVIGKMTLASVPESMSDTMVKFGVKGTFAAQYFGVAFLLVASVVALLPAGQVGAAAQEETSGRVRHILGAPTSRATWFVGRLALTAGAVIVAAFLCGAGAWLGAVSQGVDLGLGSMMAAGLNVAPTALVTLGVGAVALAVLPRAGATAAYAVVIWSLIVDLFASLVPNAKFLERTSLFHYMALAPAQDIVPSTLVLTTLVGLALCALATLLFQRRDVHGG